MIWSVTFTYGVEVEANSEKEAIEKAKDQVSEDMSVYDCEAKAVPILTSTFPEDMENSMIEIEQEANAESDPDEEFFARVDWEMDKLR